MKKEYINECPYYLEDFLTYIKVIKDRGERTEEAYFLDIRCFLRYLLLIHHDVDENAEWETIYVKDVPIEYLISFSLQNAYVYMNWLKTVRENETVTRARKTTALKEFYSYLYNKSKLIPNDNLVELEVPRVKKALPKFLTLDECQKLLMSIETKHTERDYCIITLFLNCGMRLSELTALDMNDISFENKTLRLFGKGRKERIVYLNDACIDAINAYLPLRNALNPEGSNALFLSAKKNRISKRRVQEIVENCLKAAGLENTGVTTHKLRHTAATLMYQHGSVDTLVLKDVLGHKSIATTEIYTHLSNENLRDAANSNPLSKIKK